MKRSYHLASMAVFGLLLIAGAWLFGIHGVHAQVNEGLSAVAPTIKLSSADPRVLAARIINVALGLLGIVFLVLVLYAGFLWMTSGGNAEKTGQAKTLLRNAIIGLIIILSSWAITTYVITRLLEATGGGTGSSATDGSGGSGGGGFGSGGGSFSGFQLSSIAPSGFIGIRNVRVRFILSDQVDPDSVAGAVHIYRASDNAPVDGTVSVMGAVVEFTPTASCPVVAATASTDKCFDGNTEFRAVIDRSLRSLARGGVASQRLVCGGLAPACEGRFSTGDRVDVMPPSLSITSPYFGQSVSQDELVPVMTRAVDDFAISYVSSSVGGRDLGVSSPTTTVAAFLATIPWSTRGMATGTYALRSSAHDGDSHDTVSSDVSVSIRPAHCFNGRQDDDEAGLDCGGSSCGSCAGSSCRVPTDCRSGVCGRSGVCVEQPIILGVSPNDGKGGTIITISGANFGSRPGQVRFWDGSGFGAIATAPASCSVGTTWSATQIIVTLPLTARTGAIQVTNASSSLSDVTNDTNGPVLDNFTVNDTVHPGICAIVPNAGERGDVIRLLGAALGTTSGRVLFGERDVTPASFATPWTDTSIGLNVPVIAAGTYAVHIRNGTVDSNSVAFTVTEEDLSNPVIESLDPIAGPIGEYITLTGHDFGITQGRVMFRNQRTGEQGSADVVFPAECLRDFWHDRTITVKVPRGIGLSGSSAVTPDAYKVFMVRQSDGVESNRLDFTVNTTTPRPGICAITPVGGPVGTTVTLTGERLGARTETMSFQGSVADARVNSSSISRWTDSAITGVVPSGAYSGAVRVQIGSGAPSNGVNFAVRNCNEDAAMCGVESCCRDSGQCSVGGVCAALAASSMYGWEVSTGQLPLYPEVIEECTGSAGLPPSPSPWNGRAGGSSVCVNAEAVVRFNTRMNPSTLTSSNIIVSRCTGTGSDVCATKVRVDGGRLEIGDSDGSLTGRRTMVTYAPPTDTWSASSTYDISFTTAVASQVGVAMQARSGCGPGMAYCFRFTTASSTTPCRIGATGVTPSPFTAQELDEQIPYRGNVLSAGDQCIQINPIGVSWRWYTGRPTLTDSRASLAAYTGTDCVVTPGRDPVSTTGGALTYCPWRQMATAHNETGPTDPIRVNAEASTPGDPAALGTASLYVQYVPPQVTNYGPNCKEACTEGKIWAEFNVPMDPAFATNRQVSLYKCATENCRSFSPSTPFVLSSGLVTLLPARTGSGPSTLNRRLEINPVDSLGHTYLEPGAFYKVILLADPAPCGGRAEPACNGLHSRTGLTLTNLTDRQGFSWRFRVKPENGGVCDVTRVDVVPIEKVENVVAARTLFSAEPVSVSEACGEQFLMSRGSYAWNSEFVDVSKFINATGDGTIDTTQVLPANCSGRCVNLGSEGVDGRIASCGNRVVETTDATECRHRSAPTSCGPGDAGCLCAPGDTDCVVRRDPSQNCRVLTPDSRGGEECDLGNADRGGLNGVAGSLCGVDCLWAGVSGGTCGNSRVDAGEQCDPGRACVGGDRAGSVCSTDATCTGGGRCVVNQADSGCTDHCLALGSGSVTTLGEDSQCGNHTVGAGETCDDGNVTAGDGCSATCLHEGSTPITAICGNGAIESGESCERNPDGTWPTGCNHTSCLHEGTAACALSGDPTARVSCCGNGRQEAGEDCDDNNSIGGDGCSNRCLAEGSSIGYQPHPSICGDGLRTVGEQCEATRGDGFVDGRQLSQIVGERDPDSSGRMMSRLQATYATKVGAASHGLQCGFREEMSCAGETGSGRTVDTYGLTGNGCCMARPVVTRTRYPLPDSSGVCRNTSIYFSFNQVMNEDSVRNNTLIGQVVTGACPTGTQAALPTTLYPRVCVGGITGNFHFEADGAGTRAVFSLDRALQASTTYRLIVRGDLNLSDTTSTGVRNMRGTVMSGDASWSFTTSNRVCAANTITIRDTNNAHPYLYQAADEAHDFTASVMSSQGGILMPISSVAEYGWSWQPWLSSETRILSVGETSDDTVAHRASTSTIQAHNRNGSSLIFAGIHIDRDTVNVPPTTNQVFVASHLATVSLCQRPWPAADERYGGAHLLSDTQPQTDEPSVLTGTIFENGPYYNFATNYCMDSGNNATTTDDLPPLTLRPTPATTADTSRGLLRQYLLTLDAPGVPAIFNKDAIGIRVFENPLHLSARAWYASQGFTGQPSSLAVDGYDAVRDGATLYVAAPNLTSSATGPVTSTIYLISRNPDARPQTQAIYDQLVQNWFFNANLQADDFNACKTESGDVLVENGRTIACSADWECAAHNEASQCASFKAKIQRDGQRLADFQTYMTKLETARTRDGRYPTIADGSYLQGITNSRWGSWQAVLGQALGGNLPIDPVNRFLTCGRCQYPGDTATGEPCMDSTDCRAGGSCAGVPRAPGIAAAYDPSTCWEVVNRRFICPVLPSGPSRFYQYRSIGNGSGYELGTELEAASYDRYQPPLVVGTSRCSNTGQLCQTDAQCVTYYAGTSRESSRGSCQATGGQWRYSNVCTDREFGIDAVCGNGIRSTTEACEVGDTATAACTTSDGRPGMKQQTCAPTCQSFIDGPTTRCIPLGLCGNGRVDRFMCQGAGVKYGQTCTSPTGTSTECADSRDPAGTVMSCVSISSIPRAGAEESCDEGVLNGTYGHCNRTCTGYDATCGDGLLNAGETCDNASQNGQYCDTRPSSSDGTSCNLTQSCGLDCRSSAPHCGDGQVQTGDGEQCEPGQTSVTMQSVCGSGYYPAHGIRQACTTNADCSHGYESGVCGHVAVPGEEVPADGHFPQNSCTGYMAQRCVGTGSICQYSRRLCNTDADCASTPGSGSCVPRTRVDCSVTRDCGTGGRCNAYPTQRTRSCGPLTDDGSGHEAIQCQWGGWSDCQPSASCGDGMVDAGEECDDGNMSNNDSCTSLCRRNICGDAYLQTGAEQCDYGDPARGGRNGASCSSEYGESCAVCTTSCRVQTQSGGFCGDGRRNGREQCDFVGICSRGTNAGARCTTDSVCGEGGTCTYEGVTSDITCRALGYDYVNSVVCDAIQSYVTNPDGTLACIDTSGDVSTCYVCELPGGGFGVHNSSGCTPCVGGNCVGHSARSAPGTVISGALEAACIGPHRQNLSCTNTCGLSGCGSCLGTPTSGNGMGIEGFIYDQEANVPIPAARVVITYRGNTIVDTVTDMAGRFSAANLHARRECAQYRMVVSSERDNPLTRTLEGFGYRAYDSGIFTPLDFASRVLIAGRIQLRARTGETDSSTSAGGILPGETRVTVTWTGSLPLMSIPGVSGTYVRTIAPHLLLPDSQGFVKQENRYGAGYTCTTGAITPACSTLAGTGSLICETGASGRGVYTDRGGLIQCSVASSIADGARLCCPSGGGDTSAILSYMASYPGRPIEPTPANIAALRAQACCVGAIVPGSGGALLGYNSSISCGSRAACSGTGAAGGACCLRDIGTGATWQGNPALTLAPGAVASCVAHKITTTAYCEDLRAGRVAGLDPALQGADSPLTQLACSDNTSCDEFVRTSTLTRPMTVQYVRSRREGEVYRFYLEQKHYAEAALGRTVGSSDGSTETRCYATRFAFGVAGTPSYTTGNCLSGTIREITCNGSTCSGAGLVTSGQPTIVCTGGTADTCTRMNESGYEVQITTIIGSGGSTYRSTLSTPAQFMRNEIGLQVRVLSGTDSITILPPDPSSVTMSCPSGSPYLWHVFDQNSLTGAITVLNGGHGQFECAAPAGMSGLRDNISDSTYRILGGPVANFPPPPLE